MSEFLANVNRENLESLLNFYDRVTTNEVRKKTEDLWGRLLLECCESELPSQAV